MKTTISSKGQIVREIDRIEPGGDNDGDWF